jgi:hypothetical protein
MICFRGRPPLAPFLRRAASAFFLERIRPKAMDHARVSFLFTSTEHTAAVFHQMLTVLSIWTKIEKRKQSIRSASVFLRVTLAFAFFLSLMDCAALPASNHWSIPPDLSLRANHSGCMLRFLR